MYMPPVSKAQAVARNKYDKDHFEYATLKLHKGRKAELKALAAAQGKSLNKYITDAIDAAEKTGDKK